jgi:hypothetical protein
VDGTHQYGAVASAPVFATIVRDALQELGIPPHKPAPPLPGLPLATPYYDEGEAAGPVLPGLSGTPQVQVGPPSGGAASTTSTTTIVTTTTTTQPGATPTSTGTATTATPTTTTPTTPVTQVTTTSDSQATTTTSEDAVVTTVVAPAQGQPLPSTLPVSASTGQ